MASFTARISHVLSPNVNRWPTSHTASNLAMNRASRQRLLRFSTCELLEGGSYGVSYIWGHRSSVPYAYNLS